MAKEVQWSKIILETFISEAALTEDEEWIMRTRVAGWSRTKQSQELGMSLATVDRLIKSCKNKYDQAQKFNPLLPPRRVSKEEDWMDNN